MSPQNPTLSPATTSVEETSAGMTTAEDVLPDPRMQTVIEYYALGGLMTDEAGNIRKMPVTELADLLKIDRSTVYDWRDRIPEFWGRVAAARQQLGGQSRVQTVWNGVYMQAAMGKAEQAKMFLANFDDNYRAPGEKADRNAAETLIDLMNAARQLQRETAQNNQPVQAPQQPTQAQQPLTAAPLPPHQNVIEGQTV